MFRILFIVLLLVCFSLFTSGQVDDKMNALMGYPRSKHEAIFRGREMLYQSFIDNDTTKAKEIIEYLITKVEDNNYIVLLPEEYELYCYWLRRYGKVTECTLKYDSTFIRQLEIKRFPPLDNMLERVIDKLRLERNTIYTQIESAPGYEADDKDFLKLQFDQLLSWGFGKDVAVDSLNERGRAFLSKYPNSKHFKYVKKYIGLEFRNKKWTCSAEFFTGLGFYNGNLGKSLHAVVPLGISFTFRYQRLALKLIDYIGFSKTKDSIHTNLATWRKNAAARVFIPGAVLGFYFLDGKKYKICPFIGISSSSIAPPLLQSEDAKNKDVGFDFTSTPTFGISMEFFIKPKRETEYNWIVHDLHYCRLTYTFYQPQFQRKYTGYDGAMHNLTIGFVSFANPKRRVK